MNCTALAARPTVQPLRGELRHAETLVRMVASSGRLMAALRYVRSLELRSWCIGAGLVRNLVWDALHGFDPSVPADVDVAHFDAHMPSQLDGALERRLRVLMPGLNWEVTNQAHVHRWFEADLGRIVPPLTSLDDGISTWPEFATCVGVTLAADDSIQVIAPHGLDDRTSSRSACVPGAFKSGGHA